MKVEQNIFCFSSDHAEERFGMNCQIRINDKGELVECSKWASGMVVFIFLPKN
jgi:hypothetical protein